MEGYGKQHHGENENLTLTDADLSAGGPRREPQSHAGGKKLRAFCPVHGGDNQRSLEVDLGTGRFFCHNCRAWGYMDWAREEYRRERGLDGSSAWDGEYRSERGYPSRRVVRKPPPPPPPPPPVEPVRDDLDGLLAGYQEAMPGSLGEKYLLSRCVPLDLACEYGVGYAAPGEWPQDRREDGRTDRAHLWRFGRIVVPHTRPDGTLVSLYGRAVGEAAKLPEDEVEAFKRLKHRHLGGNKGWFNARVIGDGDGPLHVVEGPFDAFSLIAFGCERTVAIFAAREWKWHWIPSSVRRMVFALDCDETGIEACEKLAAEARLRGICVAYLDAENYGDEKDAAAAYVAGVLTVGAFPATDASTPTESPDPERRNHRAEAESAIERARREARVESDLDAPVVEEPEHRPSNPANPERDDNVLAMQQRAREIREKRRQRQSARHPDGGE